MWLSIENELPCELDASEDGLVWGCISFDPLGNDEGVRLVQWDDVYYDDSNIYYWRPYYE